MCNLLGAYCVDKLDPKLLEMIASIQIIGSSTHSDGFGYFSSAEEHNKTWLAAEASAYPKELLSLDCEWVITHIRKTSTGRVAPPKADAEKEEWDTWRANKQAHAHPFVYDDVVVAHNGTFNKKNGHDYDMDSQFFSEQFQLAYLELQDVDKALEKALGFFDGGLASLLLAVKYDGMFIPYIMKGNKPLFSYTEENTGTNFFITDKDYFIPFKTIYERLFGYKFTLNAVLESGLYSPYSLEPIMKKEYIHNRTTAVTKWEKGVYSTYTPTKVSVVDATSAPLFTAFKARVGNSVLCNLTERIVNEFSDDDIAKLLDLSEDRVVSILEDMNKGATIIL